MRKCLFLLAFVPGMLLAQNPKLSLSSDFRPFKHMEVGTSAGTAGVGIEIATPINEHLNLRAGFSVMPSISNNQSYAMATVGSLSGEQDEEEQKRRIKHLCAYLNGMLNMQPVRDNDGNILDVNGDIWTKESGVDKQYNGIDEYVDMTRKVSFYNAKLLIDWYPFHKKNWHFTAGCYYGSRKIGSVYNTQEESTTMLGINMYNTMYDQIFGYTEVLPNGTEIVHPPLDEYEYPYFNWGNYYFEMDPVVGSQIKYAFGQYGRVGVRVGDDLEGNPNYLEPDENGMMKADAKVHAFKPYVGFGYDTIFGYDKRWNFGFNVGALFWGTPSVIYYEKNNKTIDLIHDVRNIKGIVGQYVKVAKYLPVYPVIEVRLAYTIF